MKSIKRKSFLWFCLIVIVVITIPFLVATLLPQNIVEKNSNEIIAEKTATEELKVTIEIEDTVFISNEDMDVTALTVEANEEIIVKNCTISGFANGAIHVDGGSVSLVNSKILNCSTSSNGGAIYASGGSVSLVNSTIEDSWCLTNGGAVYTTNNAILNIDKDSKIIGKNEDSLVSGNNAVLGGAIYANGGTVNIYGGISNCYAENGGAIYTSAETTLIMAGVVDACQAENHAGGIYSSGILFLREATISNCKALGQTGNKQGRGGAVYHVSTSRNNYFEFESGKIIECEANNGGGVYNAGHFVMGEGATIENCVARQLGAGVQSDYISAQSYSDESKYVKFVLNGGKIVNNKAYASNGYNTKAGGVMLNRYAIFEMNGGEISNNAAKVQGGNLYIHNDNCKVTINAGTISGDGETAQAQYGGGIYAKGSVILGSDVVIGGCVASNAGGGIYNASANISFFPGSKLQNCYANIDGGGIYHTAGTLTMYGGTIKGCIALSGDGGGIYNLSKCVFYDDLLENGVEDPATITQCTADTYGGGIYNSGGTFDIGGIADVSISVISECFAQYGGGLYSLTDITIDVLNGFWIIEDCEAVVDGGGIYVNGGISSDFETSLTTISVNGCSSGNNGGGICANGDLSFDVTQLSISDCSSGNNGAGIYQSTGTFATTNGTIQNCVALNGNGGAVCLINGAIMDATELSVLNCSVNTIDGLGGGVYIDSTSEFNMRSGVFRFDDLLDPDLTTITPQAYDGGAIYNLGRLYIGDLSSFYALAENNGGAIFNAGSYMYVQFAVFSHTSATNGGAIYTTSDMNLYANIVSSHASNNGGAIWVDSAANVQIRRGNIEQSSATFGGAIYSNGTLDIGGGTIDSCDASSHGGAIYHSGSSLNLGAVTIQNCSAAGYGGAVCNTKNMTIEGTTISSCTSTQRGGAIYGSTISSTIDINAGNINNCSAEYGGAIFTLGKIDLQDGTISSCAATTNGGALYLQLSSSATESDTGFVMTGGEISSCSATLGGAIYMNSYAKFTMTGGTLNNNSSSSHGGAVYMNSYSKFTLDGGTFTGSRSGGNGGAVFHGNKTAVMNFNSGTITGNGRVLNDDGESYTYDAVTGGAIHAQGTLNFKSGTVENCSASAYAGGIYTAGTMTIGTTSSTIENRPQILNCFAKSRAGGLYNTGTSSLTIINMEINGCETEGDGGAIYNYTSKTIVIDSILITECKARIGGGIANLGYLTLNNGEISWCEGSYRGGGIWDCRSFHMNGGVIKLNSCISGAGFYGHKSLDIVLQGGSIEYNRSCGNGGGIFTDNSTLSLCGTDIIYNSIELSEHESKGKAAGALLYGGTITMTAGEISNNMVAGNAGDYAGTHYPINPYGAGVYLTNSGFFTMTGGTIHGNAFHDGTYGYGGNVYINGDSATFVLDGGTISGSRAIQAQYGGGIWNDGIFIMLDGTIEECWATYGGAIFNNERMLLSGGTILDCVAEVGDAIFNGSEMALVGQSDDYDLAIDIIRNFLVAGTLSLSSGIKNILSTNHTDLTTTEIAVYAQSMLESIDAYWSTIYSVNSELVDSVDDQIVGKLDAEFEILSTNDLDMIQQLIASNITTILNSAKATQLLSTNLNKFNNELVIAGNVTLASNTFEKYNFDRGEPVVIDGEEYLLTVQYRNAHVSYMGILDKIKFDFADYTVDVGTYEELGFDLIYVDTTASRFFTHYVIDYSTEHEGITYGAYELSLFNAIDETDMLSSEDDGGGLSFEPYNFAWLPEGVIAYKRAEGGYGIETTTETVDIVIKYDLDDSYSEYEVVDGTLIFIQNEELYIDGELVVSGNVTDGYLGFDRDNGYYWVRDNDGQTIEIYAYSYYETTINIQYIDVNGNKFTQNVSETYLEMGITAFLQNGNATIENYDGQEIFNFNECDGIDKDIYEPFEFYINGEYLEVDDYYGAWATISGATTITIVCSRREVGLTIKYVDSDFNLIKEVGAPIYCGDGLEIGVVEGVQYLLKNGKTNNISDGSGLLEENTLGEGVPSGLNIEIDEESKYFSLYDYGFEMGNYLGSSIGTVIDEVTLYLIYDEFFSVNINGETKSISRRYNMISVKTEATTSEMLYAYYIDSDGVVHEKDIWTFERGEHETIYYSVTQVNSQVTNIEFTAGNPYTVESYHEEIYITTKSEFEDFQLSLDVLSYKPDNTETIGSSDVIEYTAFSEVELLLTYEVNTVNVEGGGVNLDYLVTNITVLDSGNNVLGQYSFEEQLVDTVRNNENIKVLYYEIDGQTVTDVDGDGDFECSFNFTDFSSTVQIKPVLRISSDIYASVLKSIDKLEKKTTSISYYLNSTITITATWVASGDGYIAKVVIMVDNQRTPLILELEHSIEIPERIRICYGGSVLFSEEGVTSIQYVTDGYAMAKLLDSIGLEVVFVLLA